MHFSMGHNRSDAITTFIENDQDYNEILYITFKFKYQMMNNCNLSESK